MKMDKYYHYIVVIIVYGKDLNIRNVCWHMPFQNNEWNLTKVLCVVILAGFLM